MPNKTLEKWEEKTIKQLSILICDGDWIESKNQSQSGIRLIQTGNVGNGFYKDKPENSRYISEETFKKLNCTEIFSGDCLVSRLPEPLGRACLIPNKNERMITAVDCSIIRFNDKNIIPKYFIYYSMSNNYHNKIINLSTGATRQRISRKNLETITIPTPNLKEQQRIVKILDEAFENIEKAKQNALQNLNNAKELFESYLTSILINKDNWDKKKLSDVAIDFGRGRSRHRPRNDKKLYGGQYPFIQTGDIRNSNHLITEYSQTYNEIGLAQSKLWPKGTLCITIAANIAETGVLTFDACFPDSVIGCVFDETKTNIDYVEYLLQSFKTILQAEGKGSAQDNINLGTFEKYSFPFPDKIKQDEIVDKLNCMRTNIAKLEQIYEQKIKDLDELKQSILQKAFNGEL